MKICVSVRWVTLWVRPPPWENMCVRSLGYIVGASPPVKIRDLFIDEAHMALGIFPVFFPACCLLRFAAFFGNFPIFIVEKDFRLKKLGHSSQRGPLVGEPPHLRVD